MATLQWGILSTGNIAKTFAKGLASSKSGSLLAVGSRDKDKAAKFAADLAAQRAYGSYEELLADKDVQAVYIATPHPMHARWAIAAAAAGKHILCEKPITLNYPDAMAVVDAARANDVFLMEAFMYRCHPQTAKLVELIRQQVIGDVRVIRASFAFHAGYNVESRLLANALGGGGILDVGCYTTSLARLVAGVALGREIAEPLEVKATGHVGATGVDEWAIASLRFENDILAQIATGVQIGMDNAVQIFGTAGNILIPSAWIPAREGGVVKIIVNRHREQPQEINIETGQHLYGIEADTVAANIERRQAAFPAMSWADTLGNMRTLDMWRESIGQVYEAEKPANVPTVHGRPLKVSPGGLMKYGSLPGLNKKVSRLVMGCDNQRTMPHAAVMFDDFFERGGTAFDTAYVYGGGNCERLLGQWVRNRGVREQVVILDKGAHTPMCDPKNLTRQLNESLERLGLEYMDIYMMHRDNTDIPVGEFVDVLNEHQQAGRFRAFGGSNWTLERVQAFNKYARKKGLTGFAAISNNFSLASMVNPPWSGCLGCSDAQWRVWLAKTQLAVMPWSSQARGFFVRGDPADTSDKEMVRCWYADDNFRRLQRAKELAAKKGCSTVAIALAYVLCQPFPTFPLIGPRAMDETRTSFDALQVTLTPEELKWLNLEP